VGGTHSDALREGERRKGRSAHHKFFGVGEEGVVKLSNGVCCLGRGGRSLTSGGEVFALSGFGGREKERWEK